MTSTATIIELAAFANKLVQRLEGSLEEREGEFESSNRAWNTAVSQLEPMDWMAFEVAKFLLDGELYEACSDNPESIRRAVAVAEELGARIEIVPEQREWRKQIMRLQRVTIHPRTMFRPSSQKVQ
jgi:hypothetical protein